MYVVGVDAQHTLPKAKKGFRAGGLPQVQFPLVGGDGQKQHEGSDEPVEKRTGSVDTVRISFTGTLTVQDALDLNCCRAFCVLRPSMRWLITGFSSLLVATVIFLFVHRQFNLQLLVILFICLYVPFSVWFHRDFQVRRQYRRHPEYYIESTVTVDETNVSVSNANMDLRLAWNQVAFLLDTPRGVMFVQPQLRVLCWLPQRLFEGNDSKKAIIDCATRNNVPVKVTK